MVKKTAVSNSTVLIFLSKLNRLDLLLNMYPAIIIPPHVKKEVLAKEDALLQDNVSNLIVKQAKQKRNFNLGQGETEAIILCLEETADFLSDDKKARNVAKILKINTVGTIGILLWNLQKKLLNKTECSQLVDELIKKQYYISTELYVKIKSLIENKRIA
ncbi:MAG: DUF3368 domain-containing protein [Candidatus Aenigmarchaeota archaeon]|nr:DUF3368 domain-containing protein [Candidatus Aenigmarchaeota archaeon]